MITIITIFSQINHFFTTSSTVQCALTTCFDPFSQKKFTSGLFLEAILIMTLVFSCLPRKPPRQVHSKAVVHWILEVVFLEVAFLTVEIFAVWFLFIDVLGTIT